MKLELKYIAPYLPYGLKLNFDSKYEADRVSVCDIVILKEIQEGFICVNGYKTNNKAYKPILHPIQDLKTMFEDEDTWIDKFREYACLDWCDIYEDAIRHIDETIYTGVNIQALPYQLMEWLFSLHFDVFGLTNEGLAIDINTL